MNKALRRNRIFGIISLGILTIGMWHFLLEPRFKEPEADRASTVSVDAERQAIDLRYASLMTRAESLAAATADANALNVSIPGDAQIPQLQSFIWAVGTSVGIPNNASALTNYSSMTDGTASAPKTATPDPASATEPALVTSPVYETKITVTATGTLRKVMAFVTALSDAPRAIAVGHVAFSPAGGSAGEYQVTVEGVAFATAKIPAAPTAKSIAAAGKAPVAKGSPGKAPRATSAPPVTPSK